MTFHQSFFYLSIAFNLFFSAPLQTSLNDSEFGSYVLCAIIYCVKYLITNSCINECQATVLTIAVVVIVVVVESLPISLYANGQVYFWRRIFVLLNAITLFPAIFINQTNRSIYCHRKIYTFRLRYIYLYKWFTAPFKR